MRKQILSLILAFISITFCYSQKIEIKEASGRYRYIQNGKRMTMGRLVTAMNSHPNALKIITKAQTNKTYISILGLTSGLLIGLPVGQFLSGKEANWTLAGIGAGLVIISIPLSSGIKKRTNKAVELYNSSLN